MASIMNFLGCIPKRKIRKHLYECYGNFTYEELTNFGIMKRHLSPESQKEIEFNEKTIKLLEDILFIKEKNEKE